MLNTNLDDEPVLSNTITQTAKNTAVEGLETSTEASNKINMDIPSCSSEQSSAKKITQKSHFTNRKAPSLKLAIDIVSINN